MSLRGLDSLPTPVADVVTTAAGMAHRDDPVVAGSGGPAGNARLTAWLGILLLVAFVIELATLVSLQRLVAVHIFVGALLVPLALMKTVTTTWRMVRYYTRSTVYQQAGPPPLLLRLLGPLVVVTALAVLGTGLVLIAVGTDASYQPFASFAGFAVDPFTLHKVAFVLWLLVTSLHTLGRLVPALQLMVNRAGRTHAVPGTPARVGVLLTTLVVSALVGAVVLSVSGEWTGFQHGDDYRGSAHIQDH